MDRDPDAAKPAPAANAAMSGRGEGRTGAAKEAGKPDVAEARLLAVLYDSDGCDHALSPEAIACPKDEGALLWVDVQGEAPASALCTQLQVPAQVCEAAWREGTTPRIGADGDYVWCRVAIASPGGDLKFQGRMLRILAGPGFLVTFHEQEVAFLDALREREHGRTRLGRLGSTTFMASLLHWVLESYFESVMAFEAELERVETDILEDRHNEDSVRLSTMRRAASRLRRMLAAHRSVFASLARPDFLPDANRGTQEALVAVETQFQHAMDAVENIRELVVGTLDVLTNRIALRTNRSMRILTVAATLLGFLSVVAGALGMNFQADFFDTGNQGFYWSIGMMAGLSALALLVGLRRRWF